MPNNYFRFKQFTIHQQRSAMKVTTDSCLFGAWLASELSKHSFPVSARLLDIGAGTGLLSLMVSQKNKVQIDAVEIDEEAAYQAAENIQSSPWSECIEVHHQNILHFPLQKNYDIIISNPPFYENELASEHAQKNLAHHSAALSLAQVADSIAKGLKNEGVFFLLLPYKRLQESEQVLQEKGLFIQQRIIVCQSTRHSPFRIMLKGSKAADACNETELSICNDQQQYTEAFTALLKDYYLYL